MVYCQKETALLSNYNRQFSETTSKIFGDWAHSGKRGKKQGLIKSMDFGLDLIIEFNPSY
jgi:hypothetical protein